MQSLHKTHIRDCDVTFDFSAAALAACTTNLTAAAISSKTNAQSNGWERRIYTSTPKFNANVEQQQLKKSRSSVVTTIGGLLKKTSAAAAVKWQAPTMDARLKALLLLFGVAIIGYQIINLATPYINSENLQNFYSSVQAELSAASEWCREHRLGSKLLPLLCGFLVSAFLYGMVYMDSAAPGINPPAPYLLSGSKERNRMKNTLQLSYMMAMGSGFVVTAFMYLEL